MRDILFNLKKLDWIFVAAVLILTGFGLLALYSNSAGKGDFSGFIRQAIFAGLGVFLMIAFSFFDYRFFKNDRRTTLFFYLICLLALAGLFFLAPQIRGVRSWYKIGSVSFDPYEFTKLILLIFLAQYFSVRHVELYKFTHILISGIYVFLPAGLIILQPNFGSALVLIILWIAILFISGIKLKPFLLLCFLGILALVLSWSFLMQDYQKSRIVNFLIPGVDPLRAGWNQQQAKIAIGSGGILGRGLGRGSQTQYGFLPEAQTDFIFSAIAEEFGLLGVGILLFSFIILFSRIIRIAILSQSNFPRLFSAGFTVLIMAQIFINLGMNLGFLPVIGIPLPLVSYGGATLVTTFIGLGIILSIRSRI